MNNQKNILVVDDNLMCLKSAERALSAEGYNIIKATSGMEGLLAMEGMPFDLVLMDIKMPIMDGLQVLDVMKKNDSLRNIPVIFLTAQSDASNIKQAIALGAANYIVKPFLPDDLVSRVKTVLNKRGH